MSRSSAASISRSRARGRSWDSTPPGSTTSTCPSTCAWAASRRRSRRCEALVPSAVLNARVAGALATVTDPELDRSLVELGFADAAVDPAGRVTIELRLPTYWCAANFAYLMAADAHDAVAAVPGVRSVAVRLHDHFTAGEVTDAVNAGRSFDDAFADRADGSGLAALRR